MKDEIENVYDTVDEKEYAKRVLDRAAEGWIEDDDGTGYFDDGREIFDDDEYNEDESTDTGNKSKKGSNKRARESSNNVKPVKGRGSIRNLFSNAVPKKKLITSSKLEDDDILANILGDIDDTKNEPQVATTSTSLVGTQPKPTVVAKTKKQEKEIEAAIVSEYLESFSKNIKKKELKKRDGNSSDDDLLESILKPKAKASIPKKPDPIPEVSIPTAPKPIISEPKTTLTRKPSAKFDDEDFNDMDFSVLDDIENQMDQSISEPSPPEPQVIEPEPEPEPVIKKVVDKFANSEFLLTGWNNICSKSEEQDTEVTNGNEIESNLPKLSDETDVKIWYWDAWEDPIKQAGKVFLFGRIPIANTTKEYQSVCVQVENVQRCIYLLPREFVSYQLSSYLLLLIK